MSLIQVCTHGNNSPDCIPCYRERIAALEAECEQMEGDLHQTRLALGRVMRTIKIDLLHMTNWPDHKEDFLDYVCSLLKELGRE